MLAATFLRPAGAAEGTQKEKGSQRRDGISPGGAEPGRGNVHGYGEAMGGVCWRSPLPALLGEGSASRAGFAAGDPRPPHRPAAILEQGERGAWPFSREPQGKPAGNGFMPIRWALLTAAAEEKSSSPRWRRGVLLLTTQGTPGG